MRTLLSSLWLPPRFALLALAATVATSLVVLGVTPSAFWVWGVVLSVSLCWASVVDLHRQILPNALTLGLIVIGIGSAAATSASIPLDELAGAIAGYGSLAFVKVFYLKARGRDGIGLGDAKLFAAGGAWLGWAILPYVVIGAVIIALAIVGIRRLANSAFQRHERVAFGPYLALSIWVLWMFVHSN